MLRLHSLDVQLHGSVIVSDVYAEWRNLNQKRRI
jgi:hypothetical protein